MTHELNFDNNKSKKPGYVPPEKVTVKINPKGKAQQPSQPRPQPKYDKPPYWVQR